MQNLMAALALGLAGLIIWRSWWTVIVRQSPAMAARVRGKRVDDPITAAPAMPAAKAWFAPPSNPVLELKAARIRTEPAAPPAPAPQIGRRGGWTAEDDAELLQLLTEQMSAEAIAAKLGRSEKSVQLRIPLLRLRQRQAEQAASGNQAG